MLSSGPPDASELAAATEDGALFVLEERVGSGGMADVYRAHDRTLDRRVALKILQSAGPVFTRSLLAEARAQALVDHVNVCKVFGVGQLPDGRPFIALQYIDGRTLLSAAATMNREQIVRAVRDAAEGLHAAHRLGIVHRDVKPANILVEPRAGGYHTWVTDFGLARVIEAPTLTRAGQAKGTPAYMAPEQARGETSHVDRRTDVYALGVTLYQTLTGKLPFEADSAEGMIWQVINHEATRPRAVDPSIPVDLETITLKCMEKDPAQRYESARVLADDLGAWLEGNPIAARGRSLRYRLGRWVRKHRMAVMVGAVAVVAVSAAARHELRSRREAREQAKWAQAFGEQAERNEAIRRYAALLPLHSSAFEEGLIAQSLSGIARQIAMQGRLAEGPGRAALGRGQLALDRPEAGRDELEKAWRLGFRTPEVAYALGLAYSEIYRLELLHVDGIGDPARRDEARARLVERYRAPALDYLKAASGASDVAPSFVDALIARQEQRWTDALTAAHIAEARVPWLYEAWTLEGDVHTDRAKIDEEQGDGKIALVELDEAGRSYERALAIARSAVGALRGNCHREAETALLLQSRQQSPQAAMAATQVACRQLLQAQPADGQGHAEQARALAALATYDDQHGIDARSVWQDVSLRGQAAMASSSNRPLVLATVCNLERVHGGYLIDHGQDPRQTLGRAVGWAQELLDGSPHSFEGFETLSVARADIGQWERTHGIDPSADLSAAIDAGQHALSLGINDQSAHEDIALAYMTRGQWIASTGKDPSNDLRAAIEHLEKSNRSHATVQLNLCAAWGSLFSYAVDADRSPEPIFERTSIECQKAFDLQPSLKLNALNVGTIASIEAGWRVDHNRDPTPAVERARHWLKRALEIDPGYASAWTSLGETAIYAARWELQNGRTPQSFLDEAHAALVSASRHDPDDAINECALAALFRWRAEWSWRQHLPLVHDVAEGLAHAQAALAINPQLGYAVLLQGQLLAYRVRATHGSERAAAARLAVAALQRAIGLDATVESEARPFVAELQAH